MRLRPADAPNRKLRVVSAGKGGEAARCLAFLLGQQQKHLCGENSGEFPDDAILTSSVPELLFRRAQAPSNTGEHCWPAMDIQHHLAKPNVSTLALLLQAI